MAGTYVCGGSEKQQNNRVRRFADADDQYHENEKCE